MYSYAEWFTATSSSVGGTNISGSDREVVDLTHWGIFRHFIYEKQSICLKCLRDRVAGGYSQWVYVGLVLILRRRWDPGDVESLWINNDNQ